LPPGEGEPSRVCVAAPGELYHTYFVETDAEQTMIWPDLALLAKAGFQLPAYSGFIANLGVEVPLDMAVTPFVGGHGSVETLPVLLAFRVPGRGPKQWNGVEAHLSDVAVTVQSLLGLELQSKTVGVDRSGEL
jgi:hypothetical protein